MKKLILIAIFLLCLLASPLCADLSANNQPILLSLPESVVSDVVQKCLPFQINETSDALAGTISVEKIDNLVFKDKSLAAAIRMSGRDVQLNTNFGGHQIRLNVGNIDLNFNISAVLRYDKANQTLFIKPTVSGLDEQGGQNNEVGKLIVALFNDKEIPVAIDKLQPIITDIGSKELIIDMVINDIILKPKMINIQMLPQTHVKKLTQN